MTKSLLPVSVIILTQNESDNIGRALKSVIWSNDVVLIDNSQDNTLELAKEIIPQQNLRIVNNSENKNFAMLRNLGLKLARNNWVLYLDADEEVSPDLQLEIEKVVDNKTDSGFLIKRQDYFLGKWLKYGETGNQYFLKLGKKNNGEWLRRVHETWHINGLIGRLSHPLYHYPHPTIAEFVARINRWTTLDAQEFNKQKVRSNFWKIFVFPIGKFFVNYFIKLGLLDGIQGLFMALMMSFHSFLTRAKLYQLQNRQPV